MPTLKRQLNPALKSLEKLSDELDTAQQASETTTKEVRHARRTTLRVRRDVRQQLKTADTVRKGKGSKERHTKDGKSQAAVELGQKGGAARARRLTPKQRSTLAMKAANERWKSL